LGDFGWRPRRRRWRGSPDRTREVTKEEEKEVFGESGRFVCFTFYFWRKFIFNFTTIGVSKLDGIDYYLLLHNSRKYKLLFGITTDSKPDLEFTSTRTPEMMKYFFKKIKIILFC
jgi:hypothetical protein